MIVGLNALARVLIPAGVWLAKRLPWLLSQFAVFVWFWLLPACGSAAACFASFCWWRLPGLVLAFRRVILALLLVLVGGVALVEMRTSHVEALLFSYLDRGMT